MRKVFLAFVSLFLTTFAFAQSEAIHYDVNPKFTHHATPEERLLIPALSQRVRASHIPPAPVIAVAEFQPMSGVLIRYPLGIPVSLVKELSKITDVKVIVKNANDTIQAKSYFSQNQVVMSNIGFWHINNDSYWVRDYGPWYIINGHDSIGVVDFTYNRANRQNDDLAMIYIAEKLGVERYEMPLVHTGGNYMTDGYGIAASTMLVEQENPNETAASILDITHQYLGIENYMSLLDPLGDYIAHIDCWGKFLDVDKVIIGKVPASDPRYQNYEAVAETFAQSVTPWGNNYQVYRVYANPDSYLATPYTNSLIVNDHVFVPVTGNSHDNEAVAVYQNAMPGYTIVPIMSSGYTPWLSTDALHCRTHEMADLGMLYIRHYPLLGTKSLNDNLMASANIKALSGASLIADSVTVSYRINSGDWQQQTLYDNGDSTFSFDFSSLSLNNGDEIQYYISAKDESGRKENHPYIGAPDPHVFTIEDVAVPEIAAERIKVFPNPATTSLFISNCEDIDVVGISIFDMEGRIFPCRTGKTNGFITVDVNNLSSGVYFLQVIDRNGQKYHRKIVKS